MSASFAVFSFTQSSRGLDRIVALSDGRKTARETLVALLDQRAAFRFFAAEKNQHSADAYHEANAREERFHGILRAAVGLLDGPKISPTMRDFEAASARLAGPFDRPPLAGNRSGLPGARQAEADRGRRSLEVLIDAFNAAGKETVEVKSHKTADIDRRLGLAGVDDRVWNRSARHGKSAPPNPARSRDRANDHLIIEREKVNLAVNQLFNPYLTRSSHAF
jgi:hypothetical protein